MQWCARCVARSPCRCRATQSPVGRQAGGRWSICRTPASRTGRSVAKQVLRAHRRRRGRRIGLWTLDRSSSTTCAKSADWGGWRLRNVTCLWSNVRGWCFRSEMVSLLFFEHENHYMKMLYLLSRPIFSASNSIRPPRTNYALVVLQV